MIFQTNAESVLANRPKHPTPQEPESDVTIGVWMPQSRDVNGDKPVFFPSPTVC